ncbi:MAG: hypothetical protein R3B06_26275 [Kofleriaceae bacterium]
MRSDRLLAAAALAALAVTARPADACGPYFAMELLRDRSATIGDLPEGIFDDEAARLVPPMEVFRPRTTPAPPPGVVEAALYAAGAEAFHRWRGSADPAPTAAAEAVRGFRAVLALPGPLRRGLSTSAAYSLARMNVDGRALAWCAEVRRLAEAGYVDPDGLVLACMRMEQARTTDDERAMTLAAERAALDHLGAVEDLYGIVTQTIADADEATLVATPLGQRLLAAYLYARSGELAEETRDRLWRAIDRLPTPSGADRFAAAAYLGGEFDRAERLIAGAGDAAESDVGRWVRGKLAARRGDLDDAARLVCAAADAMPAATACPDFRCGAYLPRDRARGECAALRLAIDQPVAAMAAAWAVRGRYADATYIAERVLTLDELGQFVASVAAARPPAPAAGADATAVDETDAIDETYADSWVDVTPDTLQALYGRRLMRAGRYADALPWLPEEDRAAAEAYAEAITRRDRATRDVDRAAALYDASRIARADGMELLGTEHSPDWALYGGSFDVDGYRAPYIPEPPSPVDPADYPDPADLAAAQAAFVERQAEVVQAQAEAATWQANNDRYITAAERARVAASAPASPERFHYRFLAADQAEAAADLLPHGTQAFAATLCWSARYIAMRDTDRLERLWERYVAQGPRVDIALSGGDLDFGEDCPAPLFAAVAPEPAPPPVGQLLGAGLAMLGLGMGLAWWLRRRRPAMRP